MTVEKGRENKRNMELMAMAMAMMMMMITDIDCLEHQERQVHNYPLPYKIVLMDYHYY